MQNSSAFQFSAVGRIHESTTNPRQTFEASKLEELAESIRRRGLIQPITVRPIPMVSMSQEQDASVPYSLPNCAVTAPDF